jgi:hypothetical protein
MSILELDVYYSSITVRRKPANVLNESQAAKNG